MKTNINFENSIIWHNVKKAFLTIHVLVITAALPVLFYAGLTHEDQAGQKSNSKTPTEKVVGNSTAKATVIRNTTSVIL